jgi:polysaccharide biosynthesis/export protein
MNNAWLGKAQKRMLARMQCGGRWAAAILLLAMTLCSAKAQEATNPAGTPAQKEPAAAPPPAQAQPANSSAKSAVDSRTYVIGENDVLDIDVWKEKELTRSIPVRLDGKISLPLIGEIPASGMTPLQLQEDIARRLKDFLANPAVTVIVTDPRSHHFNVMGTVAKPGSYPLSQSTTVLDAISLAGGFRDFAKETKIYVLRNVNGTPTRLPFNYKDAIKGKNPEKNVVLQPGDTVVVP